MSDPQRRIVIIEWIDAHTTGHDELSPEEITDALHFGYRTISVGVLVRSDDTGVSLCSDRQIGPDGAIHYRCAHFVPRAMIVAERTIAEPSVRPQRKRAARRAKKVIPPVDQGLTAGVLP